MTYTFIPFTRGSPAGDCPFYKLILYLVLRLYPFKPRLRRNRVAFNIRQGFNAHERRVETQVRSVTRSSSSISGRGALTGLTNTALPEMALS